MSGQNWVLARANCTLNDKLIAIKQQVEADLQEFNKLQPHKRGKRQFQSSFDDRKYVIKRMVEFSDYHGTHLIGDNEDVIIVRCDEMSISACRRGQLHLAIEPRWNSETQSCDLLINGQVHTIRQVSEKIIGDFLFTDLISDNGSDSGARE